eukprot:CAMPEP_0170484166 /NCGR_PEP_ID=MMETSP0208-20121228/3697_1 /TAXON_ID=197538 /ORGANISM="Strombidium inclinatum, Strain S3" /LENGTH=42 /DNA_ID= /DNA_START= /DNA_END= /DNA_ORIENTATION=
MAASVSEANLDHDMSEQVNESAHGGKKVLSSCDLRTEDDCSD